MNNFADNLKSLQKQFQLLDLPLFEKIKEEEYSPGHTKDALKRFREKAVNERNLRESYRGRAPYELLQNADDAGAKHAAYILCKEGMAFVHDGKWFTGDNFISLADGWSDKDPNECIGHKGLGFRSVLDITPSPYLVRVDPKGFFAVKFSWGLNQGHIMETLKRKPECREDYEKWKKSQQNICPIMFIPGLAKKNNLGAGSVIYDRIIRGDYGENFTTMFWFPATDEIERRVLEELGPMPVVSGSKEQHELVRFLVSDVSMLIPFLRNILSVSLCEDKAKLVSICKKKPESCVVGNLAIKCQNEGRVTDAFFHQLRFNSPIPTEVALAPGTPQAVKVMKEATVTLSVLVDNGQPVASSNSKFHVYFPTEEDTGFGFVVHGDFYVTPDRKRLMDGKYNEWLLGFAAQKAAGDFLTDLLKNFSPKNVFSALAPTGASGGSTAIFTNKLSEALKKRRSAYIPHVAGKALPEEALLAPAEDCGAFLEDLFTPYLPEAVPQRFFVSSFVDTAETRKFLRLAGLVEMAPKLLLDLIELVPDAQKSPSWWYGLFDYIANHGAFSAVTSDSFLGRKLVQANSGGIVEVQRDSGAVLCFPPSTAAKNIQVPECLSEVLIFLDMDLSKKITEGRESTERWVTDRLNIAKFEANDLIPRAIRSIVDSLFDGSLPVTATHLAKLWAFLKEISDIARREFTSDDYWKVVGRLPLPMSIPQKDQPIPSHLMVPAFLIYWPEGFAGKNPCLDGVEGVRRVAKDFLEVLESVSGQNVPNWVPFFEKLGVSSLPKHLRYSKGVTEEAIPLAPNGLTKFGRVAFCGDRQKDENLAVISTLKLDGLWDSYVQHSNICSAHSGAKSLHQLTLLESFTSCCRTAAREYEADDETWSSRLRSLVDGLDAHVTTAPDKGYCGVSAQKASHDFPLLDYIKMQMDTVPWLPSSTGPRVTSQCFARFPETRLISKGKTSMELGDAIFPYVIASTYSEMAKLEQFGIKALYNVDSVAPETLVKALAEIGEKLDSDWGREVVAEKGLWRLLRGAIQEIYRRLNQSDASYQVPDQLKVAVKSNTGTSFACGRVYYAKPGSATEQAFVGILPLIDVDRPHKDLFEKLSVTPLIAGETVIEELVDRASCRPAPGLREIIVNDLAPYLLAVNYDKSEKDVDRFIRRLNERFEVLASEVLAVSVTLKSDPSLGGVIPYRNYYLEKSVVQLSGAAEEYHYSLIVEGGENLSFQDLDADALGEVLVQVFMDRVTDEALGFFPRIASRFQQCRNKGDLKPMQDYLHLQLGIPAESQDTVNGLLSGDYVPEQAVALPPAPKAKVIIPEAKSNIDSNAAAESIKNKHQNGTAEKIGHLMNQVLGSGLSDGGSNKQGAPAANTEHKVSQEQQQRGLRGEIELKRRMVEDGGWEGFVLKKDTRLDRCGFDFLCLKDDVEVMVEVKTFAKNGYISVTNKELIEAGKAKDKFYLIGLLDNGQPEYEWESFILKNPFEVLTEYGEFEIDTRLQADPADIFNIKGGPGIIPDETLSQPAAGI
ncbi:DUF3883 domain-containing protein [Geomonas sp. Red69]|uniref:sacsin N-terminal ATP-binding-like domain-containing protein n=1 Tax=Geomonas diazotrophica TaxID=2843197 RepID=UPI001C10122C|nr:DUF3883 domain-containing protein [Geomonas diazotrophica]MBU5638834.1 DUF3883 domain-containing protein [Geomonas diazotrophica]